MPQATLDSILAVTRRRVAELRPQASELERRAAAAPAPRRFADALAGSLVGVIAEVKRRSPSAGAIAPGLDPVAHAAAYARGGAVAISVLTDEAHFGGSLDDLAQVARGVPVPVLRKDFILDELQLLEARAAGPAGAHGARPGVGRPRRGAYRSGAGRGARRRSHRGRGKQPRPRYVHD